MPGYKIVESVGAGVQSVTKWSDIEHHHPSDKLQEDGRVYAKINGKAEEVAGNYNGTAVYSPGGQLMVSKDIVLKNADNNSSSVAVPSPANGYIGEVNKSNGTVTILDRPGGEVMFQLRHMKIDESIKPGVKVEYGQPLGIQSGYGKGDPGYYGTHLHIDANAKYLDQADRYVRDMASGVITTDKRPANTTNIVNETPTIEHISGKFPAPPKQALADGKIEFGEKGPDVALLQEKLRAADARDAKGQVIGQDGDFGNGTKQALENYQKSHNLPATGIADTQTLTALGVIGAQQQTPAQPTPAQPTPAQPTPTQPAPTQPAPAQPAPAQPTPAQPAQNLPADVQSAKTNIESWHLGQTSAQFETSNRGPGFISTGKGDLGGKSYGLYQLSSTQGSLAEYVGQSTKYGAEFKGLEPASAAFDAKWKEVAARDPQGFSTDQHTFIKKEFFDVQNEALKGRGVDLGDRGRAVQDMLWSTSVQYRGLTPNVVANGLKEKFGEGYQLSKLSDEQIVGAVQDYKLAHNNTLFSKSPDLWPGLRDRAKNEKTELTELARDEQTLKKAGVSVPIDLEKGPAPNATGGRKTDPMADGVLKKGEEGPAVERLQEALNKAGIRDAAGKELPTTGYFGDKTEAAVRKYQEEKGLEPDGKAGNDTLTALGLKQVQPPTTRSVDPAQQPAQDPAAQPQPTQQQPAQPQPQPTQPAQQEPAQPQPTQQQPAQQQPAQQQPAQPSSTAPADQTTPVQAQPQPTQQDKPLMSNPNHPDHRLYQQALSNLEQLGPNGGFKSREDMDKAAAAVAADAKATGLRDIDHISKTSAPNGQTFLVAVQGDPTSPASKSSYIDYTQATGQTVEQSTKMSEATRQAQETPKQNEQQERATTRGPAVA